jgi:hypothetical protein
MNKWKALGLGLLFLTLAIIVWANGGDIVGWCLIGPAAWYLPIGGYKFWRDQRIITEAAAARERAAEREAAGQPKLPPMTSPGSRRLFVPPPRGK